MPSSSKPLGASAKTKPGHWVQTERKAHEEWAKLIARKPRAAMLLHQLVALIGNQNAVAISQAVLASMMNCSVETVKRAVRDLAAERWIQVIRIGKGKEAAYVINDQVVWADKRANLNLSLFSARIVADANDQDTLTLDAVPLRRIPTLYPGERQLPSGDGLPPPSQPFFDGLEPDLPSAPGADPHQIDIEDFTGPDREAVGD